MTLTALKSSGTPTLIVHSGDSPTLLVNRDITNQILYGPESIVGANANSYAVLDPLGSITVDGSQDVYMIGASGTPTVDAVPGAANWAPSPAQVAAQISALGLATASNQSTQIGAANASNGYLGGSTSGAIVANAGSTIGSEVAGLLASGSATGSAGGVPLLRYTRQLGQASTLTIPFAATTSLVSNAAINQPSYESMYQFWFASGAGTIPFAYLIYTWSDATTGRTVKQQYFAITAGNAAANALTYYVNGPAYGNQLSVSIQNLDPAINGGLTYVINQTSHVYPLDKIVQPSYATGAAPIGFTNPNGTPSLGVLGIVIAALASGATVTRLLAVYSGRAGLTVDNLGGASGDIVRVRMLDPSGSNSLYGGTTNQSFYSNTVQPGASLYAEIALPRGPVLLETHNNGTTSVTPAVTLTILDY